MSNGLLIEKVGNRCHVSGNTFAVKDKLRELGMKWDPKAVAWWCAASEFLRIKSAIGGMQVPVSTPKPTAKPATSGWGYDGAARRYSSSKHPRTGCSCGSREDLERDSDCASCKHDY